VVDYGRLADKAKAQLQGGRPVNGPPQVHPADLYERVKVHVLEEVIKANAELSKRGLDVIERVLSPSYTGRLCLSFGTSLLCQVDYTPRPDGCRIVAILSGPPNGAEISRKEFFAIHQSPERERLERLGAIPWATGLSPQRIAVHIVSGLLSGEFA